MSKQIAYKNILALLHDKNFAILTKKMEEDTLSWETFQKLKMPEGFSAKETWTIFMATRKLSGHFFPIKSYSYPSKSEGVWCSESRALGE